MSRLACQKDQSKCLCPSPHCEAGISVTDLYTRAVLVVLSSIDGGVGEVGAQRPREELTEERLRAHQLVLAITSHMTYLKVHEIGILMEVRTSTH